MAPVLQYAALVADKAVGEAHDKLGRLRARVEFDAKGKVGLKARIHNPERFEMGDGTTISNYTHIGINDPEGVTFGEDCTFNQFSYISGPVEIGDGVRIANKTSFHASSHVFEDPTRMIHEQGSVQGKITVEDDVWIGTGVRILQDVTIGEGAVVGAGAVVTDNVEPYTVVGGVPAEQIATRE